MPVTTTAKVARNPFATSKHDVTANIQHVGHELGEAAAASKAHALGLPYVDLRSFPVDLAALSLFSKAEAESAEGVPFFLHAREVRVGTTNPSNALLDELVRNLSKHYTVHLYVISKDNLEYVIQSYAKVVTPPNIEALQVKASDTADPDDLIRRLNEQAEALSASDLLGFLCGVAAKLDASDIHVETGEKQIAVRFRMDGVLQTLVHFEKSLQRPIINRIKLVSRLKFNVENLPQDGRFTFFFGEKPIDVRVSTLPSAYGEGVVMRLLGVGAVNLKLDDLGMIGRSYDIIEQELQKPNGFIITTGPTGSGKSTTLYAFLNELNDPGLKIITIEDPIEYKLAGIQQTPVDHNVDFSFAKALRSILRQDPDIVMVGEIRDSETAETALQASLTGHIVLSTLHTNDSFGAVPRLMTMGAKPYIIAQALNAVIAQRLVRRLCLKCKQQTTLQPALAEKVKRVLDAIPIAAGVKLPEPQVFYNAPGCDACHKLGYKGRIGIYEVIHINDAMKDLILKQASMLEMKQQAIKDGTLTMAQDGLLKALDGVTDVEEVFRVAGE